MPAGRPKKIVGTFEVLWLSLPTQMVMEIEVYAAELAVLRPGARVTRQDAARSIIAQWYEQRMAKVVAKARRAKRAPASAGQRRTA